jgi:pimeloyl-ACP methyl ester carboxylesterase
MARITRAYADTEIGQVHYRWLGNEGRPVLLLHQVSSSSRMFEPLMARLVERGYRAIAMDLPGFGESDPPPRDFSIPDYADATALFLDALELRAPLAVVGHHSGALVAAELAASRPERVQRLVLIGLPYYPSLEAKQARWSTKDIRPIVPVADGSHLLWEWRRLQALGPTSAPALIHREFVDTLKTAHYERTYQAAYDYIDGHRYPLVQAPALVLAGSRDLPNQEAAAALLPRGRLVLIDGGGTFMCDELVEVIAPRVLEFLDEATA